MKYSDTPLVTALLPKATAKKPEGHTLRVATITNPPLVGQLRDGIPMRELRLL